MWLELVITPVSGTSFFPKLANIPLGSSLSPIFVKSLNFLVVGCREMPDQDGNPDEGPGICRNHFRQAPEDVCKDPIA